MSSLLFLDEIYLEFRKKCALIVLIGVQCTFTLFFIHSRGKKANSVSIQFRMLEPHIFLLCLNSSNIFLSFSPVL